MRSDRLAATTPELDAAEAAWWDRFSEVCERLWTLDEGTAHALRAPYLRAAADYLRSARAGAEVTLLDIGCGSGFASRFMVDERTRVVGIDVSQAQIELARKAAAGVPHGDRMEFRVQDTGELRGSGASFDGVLGHAFLHHLSTDELDELLATLAALLRPGGRAWFLEPVYFPEGRPTIAARTRQAENVASAMARRLLMALGAIDEEPFRVAARFEREADAAGWFLSPKEVPFRPEELSKAFSGPLRLERVTWVNTASYTTAQWVSLIRSPRLRRALASTLVAASARLDLRLGRAGMARYRGLPGYGFAAIACRVA